MAATVQVKINNGASGSPTSVNAYDGFTFGRNDFIISSLPIPRPEATGTNYSWYKTLFLYVLSNGGSTNISNRKIRLMTAAPTGIYFYYKNGGSTYVQASNTISADVLTSNGSLPSGWSLLSTSFQTWDAASVAAQNTSQNGNYVLIAIGVGNNYIGGAGSAITLPDIAIQYDEQ